jgi:SAM-dependent methyltransferase
MHDSVMQFIHEQLTFETVQGREILEIGAFDVNGSPRPYINFLKPKKYVGIDSQAGKGVDLVVDGAKAHEHFGENAFDIVLCCEVLEHASDWKAVVSSAKRVLRTGGLLIFTTRSPGFPHHPYPVDLWRFNAVLFKRIFSDMNTEVLNDDPQCPGVFVKARKPKDFKEADLSNVEAIPMVKS